MALHASAYVAGAHARSYFGSLALCCCAPPPRGDEKDGKRSVVVQHYVSK